ncbi:hypothetical protein GSbR_29080 [Geobacter sp. SVR]|nr:hypothetical protein GSVR_22200 [Geobacter sp. SVR]GCF86308.1 hypothetical protein GSbR_29080 [Geobacter sp. SVR]
MKQGESGSVTTVGDILRPSKAAWIDLTLPVPAVVEKNVTAKKNHDQVKGTVNKNPSQYPNLKSALQTQQGLVSNDTGGATTALVGKIVCFGSTYYQLDSYVATYISYVTNTATPDKLTTPIFISGRIALPKMSSLVPYYSQWVVDMAQYTYHIVIAPPFVDTTPSQFAANISQTGFGGLVKSVYQPELDKMMQDPDYVPTFTDDSTGGAFSSPTNVATPAQVAAYNANGQALSDAQRAADNAKQAYMNSGGDPATGTGGDASLYQAYLGAQSHASGVQAQQAQAAADQEKEEESVTTPSGPSNPYGSDSSYDFGARLNTFITSMKVSPLFSLPSRMIGTIPGGGTSVMVVNCGRFGQFSYDFSSSFGSGLNVLKFLVMLAFTAAAVRIVTLGKG